MLKQLRMLFYPVIVFNLFTFQSLSQAASTNAPSNIRHAAYTAQFRMRFERHLADGTTVKTESTETDMFDSHGRHRVAVTETDSAGRQSTNVQISDPVSHTLKYWSVPGTTAQLVHAPDVGEDTECARKMRAITPLHPANVAGDLPIKDLGTSTILGLAVKGGQVTFLPGIIPGRSTSQMQRTNQVWTATDPALQGLMVKMISTTGDVHTMTRELVKLDRVEPDRKAFDIPEGRAVTAREGRAYYCDIKPAAPVSSAHKK